MTKNINQYFNSSLGKIAYKLFKSKQKKECSVIFLHGLGSDQNGTKVAEILKHCQSKDYNFLSFDNLGHGESDGEYQQQTLSTWRNAALELINHLQLDNIILIGSSKGGWLALIIALQKILPIKGVITLAAAPDFTKKFIDKSLDNPSSEITANPPLINKPLIKDSPQYFLLAQKLELNMPLTIIHGLQDDVVPYQTAEKLFAASINAQPNLILLAASDHRLSSKTDLERIKAEIDLMRTNLFDLS